MKASIAERTRENQREGVDAMKSLSRNEDYGKYNFSKKVNPNDFVPNSYRRKPRK